MTISRVVFTEMPVFDDVPNAAEGLGPAGDGPHTAEM
jgi:hypothetical protein